MTPPRPRPFAPWPVFEADEIEAASRVLASGRVNYWTGGECTAFEQEFAAACDRDHGISLANGTLALELAQFQGAENCPICITHTKPSETVLIYEEVCRFDARAAAGAPAKHDIRWLEAGQVFEV